ncbi:unnamed protein product [marine sediment metagenome]|uniref:Uncharacterized protein n=1 Tax=marine sediment metagenome TaxID=412755 RepID=X1QW23_9ZZZZ
MSKIQIPIPPEYAWVIPIAISFILGILVGTIIKRAIKLVLAVVALIIILAVTGSLDMTFEDLWGKAMELLPKLYETGSGYLDVLPYTSASFLIGLGLALWKA